jgi:oligopeptidase A
MNPLLETCGLPRYADIRPEHIAPAIDQILADNRALVERLGGDPEARTWDRFVVPLEDANERLSRAWGPVSHLHSVLDSPELREAYNSRLPAVTEYWAELAQDERLYDRYKAIDASGAALSVERRRVLDNELRDFRLGGAELAPEPKARFKAIQEELAALAARFEENLLDATNAWSKIVTRADLPGVPEDSLALFEDAARADAQTGCKLTLRAPSYLPVMQFCANRSLREEMYRLYVTRASEFGSAERDNSPLMVQIVKLRQEAAKLLGYADYAALSLATKMADSVDQVESFLLELAARAKPYAERDLAEVKAFAAESLGLVQPEAWDIAWVSEKLREARYAFSESEVKSYFPEPSVLAGLFRVIGTLYGLKVVEDHAPVWHDSVRFFALQDASGQTIGQFYLDLYARESKRGGAWMDDAITRRRIEGGVQIPVAYLNCNFAPPAGGKPALFTHDEVITLFHEFGHGLHHLLTGCEELGVSGINGVEWDAVELPSQFMENFCWEWPVLQGMTAHVETGTPLPRGLYDKMLAAKNFQSGLQMLRQIEFALFDIRLHRDGATTDPLALLDAVRREVAVLIPPAFNRFPHGFSHIFAGGYAAGYYSYKWAEVLSADAYALFEEAGGINPETGQHFWNEVLAVGGSRDALASFRAFRGREPSIDALLRHSGLAEDISA